MYSRVKLGSPIPLKSEYINKVFKVRRKVSVR